MLAPSDADARQHPHRPGTPPVAVRSPLALLTLAAVLAAPGGCDRPPPEPERESAAAAAGLLTEGMSAGAAESAESRTAGTAGPAKSSDWRAREPAAIAWSQPKPSVVSAPPLEDPAAAAPRLTVLDGVHRLVLPTAALRALERAVPGFRAWTPGHYASPLVDYDLYTFTPRQALFAVVADLNGDGRDDVVGEGHGGGDAVQVAVLSSPDGWDVQLLARQPLRDGELEHTASDVFLSYAPPGSYSEPAYLGDASVELATAGFYLHVFEKASSLRYLEDGEWRTLAMSD